MWKKKHDLCWPHFVKSNAKKKSKNKIKNLIKSSIYWCVFFGMIFQHMQCSHMCVCGCVIFCIQLCTWAHFSLAHMKLVISPQTIVAVAAVWLLTASACREIRNVFVFFLFVIFYVTWICICIYFITKKGQADIFSIHNISVPRYLHFGCGALKRVYIFVHLSMQLDAKGNTSGAPVWLKLQEPTCF